MRAPIDTEVIPVWYIEKWVNKNSQKGSALEHWIKKMMREWEDENRETTGKWLRLSDLPENEDTRYECPRCGNVVNYKSRIDLYTFSRWCGRCGSYNG